MVLRPSTGLYAAFVEKQSAEIKELKAQLDTATRKFEEMKSQMVETHEKEMDELKSLKARNDFLTDRAVASTRLIKKLNQNMDELKVKQETERYRLKGEHETNIKTLNDRIAHAQNSPLSHIVNNHKHAIPEATHIWGHAVKSTANHTKGVVDALNSHWLSPFAYNTHSTDRGEFESKSDYV